MSTVAGAELTKRKLIQWFDARDALICAARRQDRAGQNDPADFCMALQRAMDCDHPDSFWLKQVFAEHLPKDIREAKRMFLESALPNGDPRALCFAAVMVRSDHDYYALINNAARLGDALAMARLVYRALRIDDDADLARTYAVLSASKGEREGMYMLARCLNFEQKNYSAYEGAAELEDPVACKLYAYAFSEEQPEHYYWLAKSIDRNSVRKKDFLALIKKRLRLFKQKRCSASLMFYIGEILAAYKDTTFFAEKNDRSFLRILAIYEQISEYYRQAVITWIMCAKKLPGLNKDTRGIIARYVWSCRYEADLTVNNRHSERLSRKPVVCYSAPARATKKARIKK